MQNKLFAAIAMIMIAMIGMTGFAAATQDVTVSIGDGEGNVTIPIVVENVTDLGACHILLTYNNDVVSVTDATDGDMDVTVPNLGSDTGTVVIGAFQSDHPGLNGSVIVANITFTPVDGCSNATSDLTLKVTTLKNATSGGKIPFDIDNGTYTSIYVGGLNGDASGDGVVDMYDAMYIAKYVIGVDGYDIECPAIADVDGKDDVDIADAMYLAKHLIGCDGFETLK